MTEDQPGREITEYFTRDDLFPRPSWRDGKWGREAPAVERVFQMAREELKYLALKHGLEGKPFGELVLNTRDTRGIPKIVPPDVLNALYVEAREDLVAEIDRELNKYYLGGVLDKTAAERLIRKEAGTLEDLALSNPDFRRRLGIDD